MTTESEKPPTPPELEAAVSAATESALDALRSMFELGDRRALMDAIRVCARRAIVMPEWVQDAYIDAHDKVLNCRVSSWDEAFGAPMRKGAHLAAERKRRVLMPRVWNEVNLARQQGCPVDEALFERVGKHLGLGKTLVSEYYYSYGEVMALHKPWQKQVPQKTKK